MVPLDILQSNHFTVTASGLVLNDGIVQSVSNPATSAQAGSVLSVLSLNRNRNRNRNSNRNRNRNQDPGGHGANAEPWKERDKLYAMKADWIDLPVPLPPSPEMLRADAKELLIKQALRKTEPESHRVDEILREANLELSGYLRPLGIEGFSGFDATEQLFYLIIALTDEIGLHYKDRYNVVRPNQIEPRLNPLLPNPPHQSYPSNHALQSFSVAFIFSRILPEHPASSELMNSARRIAENREWAGLHYKSDTEAGYQLARMLTPCLEHVCEDQMLAALAEWI